MRTYAQAVAFAEYQRRYSSTNWYRQCQGFARQCVGANAFGSTALAAWHSIPSSHRHTGTPPPGSIAYYDDPRRSGEAGHAVFVVESGYCYSNDIKRTGKIDKVHYTLITAAWGLRYIGWIDWCPSGYLPVVKPVVAKPVVHVSRVQPGMRGAEVLVVQRALRAEPKILLDYSTGPGVFGPRTTAAYAKWQVMLGFRGADADGAPGITSLASLGKRHNFLAAP